MNSISITPGSSLKGELVVPGDKSISHRSIMLGAIANGVTTVRGFLRGEDNMATMAAFRAMGVRIDDDGHLLSIHGRGLHGLEEPGDVLDCGNSGTSMRLLTGLLAGQNFFSVLSGDQYLRKRPMKRVVEPLSRMGARILGRAGGNLAPLAISGGTLNAIGYESPVSSAQIKSAIMLAGLYADGDTSVREPSLSRDHSERMFALFGASLETFHNGVTVKGGIELHAQEIHVPGDISSAAFFIVAALITPDSELLIRNVGVNPTRTGIIDVLRSMGGSIELVDEREVSAEPVADILVRSSRLKGVRIEGQTVPRAIDEFPAICVAAACAEGTTSIRDARELRVKETDRISAMAVNLRTLGVTVDECDEGMDITGVERLGGGVAESFGDHRIAMSLSVAGLVSADAVRVNDIDCVSTSFPNFFSLLERFRTGAP
ncbi:3-phosphoshikimate 1-carboxyvinyltransferase [Pelobacter propionicus]|uniref:3-phosphoshikimate 1-carboxyvinyltransferase n=1 Tax=Pelobacter propionicus (strain DSM 2379 / NBRC 103807 / OttBd1) TaxID=338966 RepID=AROA_PELPD|nr:3-phosphoshikimate 1-carboxyvinyltransferase [Pelobacter propionicus]A1ANP7.1 RecName: Full=3-phosphoshikimate 1-carboxyvinyltransferase; AltName: Full=5-enolpyruvylshikimate-3-phosphate synthase; Short=EPSP synthase; Short=EPSPS [Pelobacter propionicus DSM 2379]ABK98967.1 3-phosphoshikimate 1-carboxyvinyltransferase [Pelobacter propionicus DSM 2379]